MLPPPMARSPRSSLALALAARRSSRPAARTAPRGPPGPVRQARPGLPAQCRARRDLPGPAAGLRRRGGRHPQRRGAVVLDRQRQAAAGRPRAVRDPRHPRSGPGAREGARRGRGDGARAAPAGRRHRPAADRAPARPRGQARRGHRPALRRRRPELDRARRRRRPGQGAQGEHRLPGGHRAAGAARRRGHGVLERRGRRARRPSARACTSSRSTTSAPRPTPSSCCA